LNYTRRFKIKSTINEKVFFSCLQMLSYMNFYVNNFNVLNGIFFINKSI